MGKKSVTGVLSFNGLKPNWQEGWVGHIFIPVGGVKFKQKILSERILKNRTAQEKHVSPTENKTEVTTKPLQKNEDITRSLSSRTSLEEVSRKTGTYVTLEPWHFSISSTNNNPLVLFSLPRKCLPFKAFFLANKLAFCVLSPNFITWAVQIFLWWLTLQTWPFFIT